MYTAVVLFEGRYDCVYDDGVRVYTHLKGIETSSGAKHR